MAYISEYASIKCTKMIFRNKEEEEKLRDSEEVKRSVREVRNGNLSQKEYNYIRLINGTSGEEVAWRKDDWLEDSGLLLLDFDYKDDENNKYKNVDEIFSPHIEEWGVVHMEESIRGGAHITVRKIEGLTPSQIVRLYQIKTGLTPDYNGLNLCKACFIVPNDMVHYVNDELYYTMEPIPPMPLKEEDKLLIEEYEAEAERLHQEAIKLRLANAQRYTPQGDEQEETCRIIETMDKSGVSVDDYDTWVNIGLIIAHILGEGGRNHYHIFSRNSYKYKPYDCDKKYDNLVKTTRGEAGLGTLIWFARNEGVIV